MGGLVDYISKSDSRGVPQRKIGALSLVFETDIIIIIIIIQLSSYKQ